MAVVNGEKSCYCGAEQTEQTSEAERRIRGESGHCHRQSGHARTDQKNHLPFPSDPCTRQQQQQQQQNQHSTASPLRNHHQQQQQQLKHHHNHSSRLQTNVNQTLAAAVAAAAAAAAAAATTTTCYHHQSSSELQPTITTTTTAPNSTSPILVSKKNNVGHSCKVVKKYRSSRMRRVKRQEYKKLREMVPALQEKNKVSKVVVIEEAIKYIDELHSALVQRFKARDIPTTFNGVHLDPREVHGGNIRELIRRLLANANPNSLPPARIENVRTLPSFLQKLGRHKKS